MSDGYSIEAAVIALTATVGALLAKLQTQGVVPKHEIDNTISAALAAAVNGNPGYKSELKATFKALFPFAEITELQGPDTPLN